MYRLIALLLSGSLLALGGGLSVLEANAATPLSSVSAVSVRVGSTSSSSSSGRRGGGLFIVPSGGSRYSSGGGFSGGK